MNENKVLKRLGFIEIALINNKPSDDDLLMRRLLFEKMTPLSMNIDDNWSNGIIQKVLCYCDDFREINEGEVIPKYQVMFRRHSDNSTTLEDITEIK